MKNAQQEELKHFDINPGFLLRKMSKWRITLKSILFNDGDIVKLGEKAEVKAE